MRLPLVLVLAACGTQQPAPAPWTNGTRVRAYDYRSDADPGFATLAGCYDSELGGHCAFVQSADALDKCPQPLADLLPATPTHHTYNGVDYAAIETSDGFSVITSIDGPTQSVVDNAPTRLRNRYEESGDLRRLVGVYDSQLDMNCLPLITTGAGIRCLPLTIDRSSGVGNAFTTNACTGTQVKAASAPGLYENYDGIYRCEGMTTLWTYGPMLTCVAISAAPCTNVTGEIAELSYADE